MKLLSRITFLAFLFSSLTNAATLSSTIPLGSRQIEPGKTDTLPLFNLYSAEKYNVSCLIKNESAPVNESSHARILVKDVDDKSSIFLNGQDFGSYRNMLFDFPNQGIMIAVTRVSQLSTIQIRNLDYTDTISLIDCKGTLIS